jgi:hypothetical protein
MGNACVLASWMCWRFRGLIGAERYDFCGVEELILERERPRKALHQSGNGSDLVAERALIGTKPWAELANGGGTPI